MTTWWLDAGAGGNDSTGNGSFATPWKTVSKAHTSAVSGDTVVFKSSATAYTWASLAFTKSLTFQGVDVPLQSPLTGL